MNSRAVSRRAPQRWIQGGACLVDVNVISPLYTTGHAIADARANRSIVNVVSGAHMGMKAWTFTARPRRVASMTYACDRAQDTGVRVNGLSPFVALHDGRAGISERPRAARQLPPPEQNSPVVNSSSPICQERARAAHPDRSAGGLSTPIRRCGAAGGTLGVERRLAIALTNEFCARWAAASWAWRTGRSI